MHFYQTEPSRVRSGQPRLEMVFAKVQGLVTSLWTERSPAKRTRAQRELAVNRHELRHQGARGQGGEAGPRARIEDPIPGPKRTELHGSIGAVAVPVAGGVAGPPVSKASAISRFIIHPGSGDCGRGRHD